MPRFHIVSDIHRDIPANGYAPSVPDCDVVIVAGDVQQPLTQALPWLRRAYPDHPVLYVPGNHDFYSAVIKDRPEFKTTYERERELAPKVAEQHDISLLDNGICTVKGVRVLGTTLWTDFGCRPAYMSFHDAVREASKGMNDYRAIKVGRGRGGDRLMPRNTIDAHKVAVRWLTDQLSIPHSGETIVVSHHAPSPRSLTGQPLGDLERGVRAYRDLDFCYASDLEHMMHGARAPSLWIHGHIHSNRDYVVGSTRVLANPRGYPKYEMQNAPRENPDFMADLVIEVGHEPTPTWRM
jgi:hypothetical protein